MKELSIYIHIPFCKSKCYYCDFASYGNANDKIPKYIESLFKEMDFYISEIKAYRIKSIFFGGGTPSSIDSKYIEDIMKYLRDNLNIHREAEISLELNPGTINMEKARAYRRAGVNRISMGVQSFNDPILKSIGRIHSRNEVIRSYEILRQVGFTNISMDFIFGLPNETISHIRDNLKEAISLGPDHISYYSLILEEGTHLYDLDNKLDLNFPDEVGEREMYYTIVDLLEKNGYRQYEISNFAKPGKESYHNLVYWNVKDYIGFGNSSHSNYRGMRYGNVDSMSDYIDRIQLGKKPIDIMEEISFEDEMKEVIILGLRKTKGISLGEFYKRFKLDLEEYYNQPVEKNLRAGLIEIKDDYLRLTKRGLDLSNQVELDFYMK